MKEVIDQTALATKRGRKLAKHLINALNEYIKENFPQDENREDDLIVAYGIDIFFSDCVYHTADLFRSEDESIDEFLQKRMASLTDFMRVKAKEIGLK